MEAVILIGLQGAGKSTFFKERFFYTHIRINLDMLRTRRRERVLVAACLEAKQAFAVDNTSPTPEVRQGYIAQAQAAGFRVVGYYFQSDLEACLRRNARRAGGAIIPEAGVRATLARLQPPSRREGFDELYSVRVNDGGGFHVEPLREDD